MALKHLVLLALAAFAALASAEDGKKEFPLVWVCLGITVAGVVVALYVAYRRPDELHLPGSVVMTAQETDYADGLPSADQQGAQEEPTYGYKASNGVPV